MKGGGKLVPGLAVILIMAGLTLAGVAAHAIRLAHAPDPSTTIPTWVSASVPAQASPSAGSMPASVPMRVIIPAIGVNSPVMIVGQNNDGTVQTPPLGDHNLAGWYDHSVTPGQRGSSVIVGHVDSYTGPSVFFDLKNLRPGDAVEVQLADGRTAVFTVDGTQVTSKTSFPTQAVYGDPGFPSLRLVTCGGPFDYATGHYLDNIIVYADITGQS